MTGSRKRRERRQDTAVHIRPGRSGDARREGRSIELVVGGQDEGTIESEQLRLIQGTGVRGGDGGSQIGRRQRCGQRLVGERIVAAQHQQRGTAPQKVASTRQHGFAMP